MVKILFLQSVVVLKANGYFPINKYSYLIVCIKNKLQSFVELGTFV